jgi:D-alanyl-lipoteichoic acid acyltransferase DltB (MBOAT superfamily)
MQFNSYSYLIYLGLAAALFWWLPVRMRRGFVLGASLLFYASWSLLLVLLPLAVSTVTYGCALWMTRHPERKRVGLGLGIGTVLTVLAYFKYRFFLAQVASQLLGLPQGGSSRMLGIALPLGISFYTFEAISYLLDVRQGRVKEIRFMDLLLFVLFWPHLMAGPIVRVRELVPQLTFQRVFEAHFVFAGMNRILLGLVQKNLLANSLAGWVNEGFLAGMAKANSTVDAWTLAVAFGLQIYFDFAAYSNIAIGSAQLIGVTLPENFNYPYWAGTPPEFWARWHMTLSRWMRDYLFFPVNAKYGGRATVLYPSMIAIMSLVGLWHGAGWGFILWGTMHGLYLVAYRAYQSWRGTAMEKGQSPWVERVLVRAVTVVGIAAAWVPFRAATLGQAGILLKTMFTTIDLRISYSVNFYLVTALLALYCITEPWLGRGLQWTEQRWRELQWGGAGFDLVLRPALWSLAIILFLAFDDQDTAFIYFQF